MDSCDILFTGYTNWDYGAPMAVRSFLEEYDLAWKTVLSFCSHGTGRLSSSIRQLRESAPHAVIGMPLGISRNDMNAAPEKIHT